MPIGTYNHERYFRKCLERGHFGRLSYSGWFFSIKYLSMPCCEKQLCGDSLSVAVGLDTITTTLTLTVSSLKTLRNKI